MRPAALITLADLDVMALTVWAEARGESPLGMAAVAWVIRNRFQHPCWWSRHAGDGIPDDTLKAVCLAPNQFSCWNPSDPNYTKLINLTTLENPATQRIKTLCQDVLDANPDDDPTHGANHYCTSSVAAKTAWARGHAAVAVIGNHRFYRL